MAPESVLALVPALGGQLGRVTVVGCEPVSLADGIGPSPLVAAREPEPDGSSSTWPTGLPGTRRHRQPEGSHPHESAGQ